jgi:putative tricarboxylic transport membrane protein
VRAPERLRLWRNIAEAKGDLGVSHEPEEFVHEGIGDTVSTRVMELVVAGGLMIVGIVVMADSWRVGAGWASDGPQAGYFPFYIGVILFIASAITFLVHAFTKQPDLTTFVKRSKLWLVLKVLVPTAGFVVLTGLLGIYVAAAIFITFFMCWLGRYSLFKAVPVGVAVPIVLFWLFEIMFLIPLPRGPLEAALGF